MNCSRNDNPAKYLRKCAKLAVSTQLSEDDFVKPFLPQYHTAARSAYQWARSTSAAIPKKAGKVGAA